MEFSRPDPTGKW